MNHPNIALIYIMDIQNDIMLKVLIYFSVI